MSWTFYLRGLFLLIFLLGSSYSGQTEHRQYTKTERVDTQSYAQNSRQRPQQQEDVLEVSLWALLLIISFALLSVIVYAATLSSTWGILALVSAIASIIGWTPSILFGISESNAGGMLSGLPLALALLGLWISMMLLGLAWGFSGLLAGLPILIAVGFGAFGLAVLSLCLTIVAMS